MYVIAVLFLFALLGGSKGTDETEKLKITVYQEALCPDCKLFVLNQLVPMLGEFGRYPDWLSIDLVPFGFAVKNGSHYDCPYGPAECNGNKLQACVVDQLVTKRAENPLYIRLANFLYCINNSRHQIKSAKKCSKRSGVDYKQLMKCYNSNYGKKLIDGYAKRTASLKPALNFLPTIVLNDKFNETETEWAQEDLYGLVCTYVPDQCI